MNINKVTLHISQMTCINCKNKIEKTLDNIQGIGNITVSYEKGIAYIEYDDDIIQIKKILANLDEIGYPATLSSDNVKTDFIKIICIFIIITTLYIILSTTGILNMLVPSKLADSSMGYGMLLIIGLITSVHCVAMCGGINLSQSIEQNNNFSNNKSFFFSPSFIYNIGRVLSYTIIGFIMGFAGLLIGGDASIGFSLFFQGILKIIAGIFMVIMEINILGLFPWLRKLTLRPPKLLIGIIGKKKSKMRGPFYVGILNGLMPCGPLQSMWIVALAT